MPQYFCPVSVEAFGTFEEMVVQFIYWGSAALYSGWNYARGGAVFAMRIGEIIGEMPPRRFD
jgi:hypothetical protein